MFLLNTFGNLARTFTFIKETHDLLNMFTSGVSAVLNFTIFVQVLFYWKNKVPDEKNAEMKEFEPIPNGNSEEKEMV